jgi:hypothetical protein
MGATLPPAVARNTSWAVLVIGLCGCSASDDPSDDQSPDPMPTGTTTATSSATATSPPSCTLGQTIACACSNGAPSTQTCGPAGDFGPCQCQSIGPLVCGGNACRGTGSCGGDGRCPAFLGYCFTKDEFETCSTYCQSLGATCAEGACEADGTAAAAAGYTWVSYGAASAAQCEASAGPEEVGFDQCRTPIWLQPAKPLDDVIRCCCKQG